MRTSTKLLATLWLPCIGRSAVNGLHNKIKVYRLHLLYTLGLRLHTSLYELALAWIWGPVGICFVLSFARCTFLERWKVTNIDTQFCLALPPPDSSIERKMKIVVDVNFVGGFESFVWQRTVVCVCALCSNILCHDDDDDNRKRLRKKKVSMFPFIFALCSVILSFLFCPFSLFGWPATEAWHSTHTHREWLLLVIIIAKAI